MQQIKLGLVKIPIFRVLSRVFDHFFRGIERKHEKFSCYVIFFMKTFMKPAIRIQDKCIAGSKIVRK